MPSRTRLPRSFSFRTSPVTLVSLISALILTTTFSSQVVASSLHSGERSGSVHPALINLANGPAHGFHSNDRIVADPHHHNHRKRRERDNGEEESTPAPTRTRDVDEPPSSVSVGTEIVVATPTVTEAPIPSPFDTNLNTKNFTAEGCPAFFEWFLKNDAFKECVPMSLFIRTSSAFSEIIQSFARITRLLEIACATPKERCSRLMSELADKIVEEDACGADYDRGNPLVEMARNGFLSYPYVRDATCLMNPDTDNYCYADASTNSTSTAGVYPFYIGVGLTFPSGVRPICNRCLQAVMQIYAGAAKIKEQPVSGIYNDAAEKINIGCGPSFIEEVTVVPSGASALLSQIHNNWISIGQFFLLYVTGLLLLGNAL